jgi:hypothetical protein
LGDFLIWQFGNLKRERGGSSRMICGVYRNAYALRHPKSILFLGGSSPGSFLWFDGTAEAVP